MTPITLSVSVICEPVLLDICICQDINIHADVKVHVAPVTDYNILSNKPRINGVELIGDVELDPGIPGGGNNGDVLMLDGGEATWKTPANSAEQDNTRPITAAAVYTEIGNINALLQTI